MSKKHKEKEHQPTQPTRSSSEVLQQNWRWIFSLGVVLILLGAVTIIFPVMVTRMIQFLIGWALVIGGTSLTVHAFWTQKWTGVLMTLMSGVLYLTVGVLMLVRPDQGVVTLSLLLFLIFIVEGLFKLVLAFRLRPWPTWLWLLGNSLIALALAVLIGYRSQQNAEWTLRELGFMVGADLAIGGLVMVFLAMPARAKKAAKQPSPSPKAESAPPPAMDESPMPEQSSPPQETD